MEGQIKIDECVVDKSISKTQIEYESIWFGFYYVYEITKKNIELIKMKCHDLKHYVFAVGDVDEKKHGGHLRLCVQDGQRGVGHRAYVKEPYLQARKHQLHRGQERRQQRHAGRVICCVNAQNANLTFVSKHCNQRQKRQ